MTSKTKKAKRKQVRRGKVGDLRASVEEDVLQLADGEASAESRCALEPSMEAKNLVARGC
jgi:hypothetical protein